ncbi:hypothetical protein ABH007_20630 [Bacteroides thetaiotaomicron]|uniref:hypothetical protein n=1 Tax=Bacteroides thetaiotaomicron TaxID=818 RepID=UPI002330999F|nr:hypothetical protein [Bacteroides thetaiotaomicron]MDC2014725.1 hypothetical protein [Bacteroides thetaiotaomicron]MDC2019278.1 hypothetical protein [Bacteroides thetaiotaomicron]MDC2037105.1 hypothetical protein [Bacteroides thetaiotaomicron]MDC2041376.1 hypothetical protein [Bacteroides thetaiotaomicron]MDC2045900.1 hypothetical protein [Bacteroides thetaiotaomicron]
MKYSIRIDRFWLYYFIIRILFLIFTVYVYARLTQLGDTERYLNASLNSIMDFSFLWNSTKMMDAIGSLGSVLGGSNILTNLPFTLLSFFTIKWVIDKYQFCQYINNCFLLFILSLPNFCIWTSVCSKETIGLVFSAILGSLVLDFLNGNYVIQKKHLFAVYLCLLFKPQYFLFIAQGLFVIYVMNHFCKTALRKMFFGCLMVVCNLMILYLIKDVVNEYADVMYAHFDLNDAKSTRDNPWLKANDFFYEAPQGMFVAFFGPTLSEMMHTPTHLIAGIESCVLLILFIILGGKFLYRLLYQYKLNVTIFFSYFIIITGIALLHYPFGIFNPGSAIRYRTNFLFLFILLFLYLQKIYKSKFYQRETYSAIGVK